MVSYAVVWRCIVRFPSFLSCSARHTYSIPFYPSTHPPIRPLTLLYHCTIHPPILPPTQPHVLQHDTGYNSKHGGKWHVKNLRLFVEGTYGVEASNRLFHGMDQVRERVS